MLDPPLQNEVDGPRISQNPSEVRPEPYHPNRLTNLPSRTAGILSILHSLLLGKNQERLPGFLWWKFVMEICWKVFQSDGGLESTAIWISKVNSWWKLTTFTSMGDLWPMSPSQSKTCTDSNYPPPWFAQCFPSQPVQGRTWDHCGPMHCCNGRRCRTRWSFVKLESFFHNPILVPMWFSRQLNLVQIGRKGFVHPFA